MKRILKFLFPSVILLFLLLFSPMSLADNTTSGEYGTISWNLSDDGVLTISGEGAIPDSPQFWYGCRDRINKVVIGTGITRIGNSAFENCSLSEIEISDTVESIGGNAFYSCDQLTSITIPAGVKTIEDTIFTWCSSLSRIDVVPQNTAFTSIDGVLYSKDLTVIYAYPANKTNTSFSIPSTITHVGHGAFFRCSKLEDVSIPESVNSIDDFAFAFCYNLKTVNLPTNLKCINSCTFEETAIEEIIMPDSVERIESCAFYCCSQLRRITIPENVEFISNNNAIPGNVTIVCDRGSYAETWAKQYGYTIEYISGEIGEDDPDTIAHGEYNSLRWVLSKAGVLTVSGEGAIPEGTQLWYGCREKINKVIIGDGITRIGSSAFEQCPLDEITISDTVESIGDNAFYACRQLTSITIPAGVKTIDGSIFPWCSNLSRIDVAPQNTEFTSVDGVLYSKDLSVLCTYPANKIGTSFIIPDNVTCIGDGAFFCCNRLIEIIVPESVDTITDFAFAFCSSLKNVNIPSKVSVITSCSFEQTAIESIELPNSITRIESCAFYLCGALTRITIPRTVTEISTNNAIPANSTIACERDSYADTWAKQFGYSIEYIPHVHSVVSIPAVEPQSTSTGLTEGSRCSTCGDVLIPQKVIPSLNSMNTLYLPYELQRIEDEAFMNITCDAVIISENCQYIGHRAFADCDNLCYVKIPSFTSLAIEPDAFEGSDNVFVFRG